MRIEFDNKGTTAVRRDSLLRGDCFTTEVGSKEIYMVTDGDEYESAYEDVCLNDGMTSYEDEDSFVFPVSAKVVVEG